MNPSPTLSKNGLTVLAKRYFVKDEHGQPIEDAGGLFTRVATDLAQSDRLYGATEAEIAKTAEAFYRLMAVGDFLPNSPTLSNAGARKMSYSACFVLPVEDDLGSIFETIKNAALIHQTGGGTGFSFSRLRPKNDFVNSTKGVSSGPTSFMDVFNAATESIKQGGMRRGANMGILRIDHPDIMDFIQHKEDLSKLTNFNISVAVTDTFMAAVQAGTPYDLVNPRTGEVAGQLDAPTVFKDIVQRAWTTGEPGLVFMDRMNRYCPVPWMGSYEATNPCFAAGTLVTAREGNGKPFDAPIESLVGRDVDVYDGETWRTTCFRETGRDQAVLRFKLALVGPDDAFEVVATPSHTFYTSAGEKVKGADVTPGMKLLMAGALQVAETLQMPIDETGFLVEAVEPAGVAEIVYCCTVPETHRFTLACGLVVGNCGEQPLIPYESCNLGSINLERFVVKVGTGFGVDWKRLGEVVDVSMHLLDNVIDANHYPLPQVRDVTLATRKVGLGIMGFGRLLFMLGIGYGSPEAVQIAEEVMSFIDWRSKVASVKLAAARGSFPAREGHEQESNAILRAWCEERHARPNRHPDANYLDLADFIEARGIRHSTTTTVAPTGTISMIADCSSGCEPVFALAFKRWQAETHMLDADPFFRSYLEAHLSPEEVAIALFEIDEKYHGSLMEAFEAERAAQADSWVSKLPLRAVSFFQTAHDITPADHVHIQAAFQHYNDSATSKTINFAEGATLEDVETAYRLAWETGCKGITVYRNNSRQFQPLSTTKAAPAVPEPVAAVAEPVKVGPRPRAEDLYGFTRSVQTGDGKVYTVINYDEHGPREVFANVGRAGGTLFGLAEAIGRLVSLALQHRVPVDDVARSLVGIRGANPYGFGANQVLSIPDAIGKALRQAPRSIQGVLTSVEAPVHAVAAPVLVTAGGVPEAVELHGHSPECPECGGGLEFGEGCAKCRSCGYSKCG